MSDRFYCEPPLPDDCSSYTLAGPEGHHLVRVMRKREGDSLVLFDGTGREFEALIQSVKKDSAELSIESIRHIDRERKIQVELAVAIPKGDRQKVLLEKAVEIGVHRLIPLQTERSQNHYSAKSLERWHRYIVEASKQCRRNRLMQIGENCSFLEMARQMDRGSRWIAHPYPTPPERRDLEGAGPIETDPIETGLESPPTETTGGASIHGDSKVTIAIGPEGGFTTHEAELALDNGWKRLDLGPRILRVETAAIAAVCRFDS